MTKYPDTTTIDNSELSEFLKNLKDNPAKNTQNEVTKSIDSQKGSQPKSNDDVSARKNTESTDINQPQNQGATLDNHKVNQLPEEVTSLKAEVSNCATKNQDDIRIKSFQEKVISLENQIEAQGKTIDALMMISIFNTQSLESHITNDQIHLNENSLFYVIVASLTSLLCTNKDPAVKLLFAEYITKEPFDEFLHDFCGKDSVTLLNDPDNQN